MEKLIAIALLASAPFALGGCAANTDATLRAAADGSDPTVCRQIETTGTRFRERVCKTVSTWAKIDAEAKENADSVQGAFSRGVNNTDTGGGFGSGPNN